jgi:hypothetical protein
MYVEQQMTAGQQMTVGQFWEQMRRLSQTSVKALTFLRRQESREILRWHGRHHPCCGRRPRRAAR